MRPGFIVSFFVSAIVLVSCQKEASLETGSGGNGGGNTGNGDYFPRTANSNWSYEYDDNPDDTVNITAISPTVNLSGNTYNVFIQTYDASQGYDSSGYYRKSGSNYYQWIDVGNYIGFDNPLWVEEIFLKDNLAAGGSWTSDAYTGSVQGVGSFTIRIKNIIIKKDEAVTVNNTVYDSTIVVEQRLEQNTGGNWVDISQGVGTLRSYYAKNIGLIQQELYDGGNNLASQMQIRRYQVY